MSCGKSRRVCSVIVFCMLTACGKTDIGLPAGGDVLPSWADGVAKSAILKFVRTVTDPENTSYVAPADRLAVFDNDGTLIVERPTLVQFEFLYRRIKMLAENNPDWPATQPFKAVLEDDRQLLAEMNFRTRGAIVAAGQADITQEEFRIAVADFLSVGRHSRFGARYVELVYQPMLELIGYLRVNGFKVFVVSGGGIEFIRNYSEEVYGVPRERVIGSSMKTALDEQDGRLIIVRKPGFSSLNAGRFKPLNIKLHTGRRPIMAVGNSDGDLEMLRFAEGNELPSLVLLMHHDDAEREYEYADDSVQARQAARDRGWQVVSMRTDFKTIFPVAGP